ncbi:MAG: hypothetical protein ACI3W5_17655 [Faecousia sp.]
MTTNRFKRVITHFLLCAFVICLFSACEYAPEAGETSSNQNSGGDAVVELTQRQIHILADVGLSTDYEKLTDSQKNDIKAIEEMLCYLEDTYVGTVTYKSFTQASPLNDEVLTAEIDGNVITVTRNYEEGKYVYTDDYAAVVSNEKYESSIAAFFEERDINVKVYAEISSLENGTDDILSSANASVFVFICGEMSRSDLEELVATYGEWYSPKLNGVANTTRFYVVSNFDFQDIGKANYYDCLQEVSDENEIICIISADGSISTR